MYHAREVVTANETATGEQQKELAGLKDETEQTKLWTENWFDGLTYCPQFIQK